MHKLTYLFRRKWAASLLLVRVVCSTKRTIKLPVLSPRSTIGIKSAVPEFAHIARNLCFPFRPRQTSGEANVAYTLCGSRKTFMDIIVIGVVVIGVVVLGVGVIGVGVLGVLGVVVGFGS